MQIVTAQRPFCDSVIPNGMCVGLWIFQKFNVRCKLSEIYYGRLSYNLNANCCIPFSLVYTTVLCAYTAGCCLYVCSCWCGGELCAAGLSLCGCRLCTLTHSTRPTLRRHMPMYFTHHHHKSVYSAILAYLWSTATCTTTTVGWPLFQDNLGKLVPEK